MKFRLGRCVATRNAVALLADQDINPLHLLMRHSNGDKLWVITEWDRSMTTILLPKDY